MDSVEKYNRLADRLRRKLMSIYFFRSFLKGATIGFFIWGILVLVAKGMQWDNPWWHYLPGLSLMIPLVAGLMVTIKKAPSHASLKALLDRHAAGGGLITASEEVNIGAWSQMVPDHAGPRFKWQSRRIVAPFVLSIAFLAAAWLAPQRLLSASPARLDVDAELNQLDRQLTVLAEEEILNEEQVQEYRNDIDELNKKADAGDASGLWEAMDHLDQTLENAAEKEAQDILKQLEENALANQLADTMRNNPGQLSVAALAEAGKQLASMAQNQATPEAMEASKLSPEDLKKLMDQLSQGQCDLTMLQQMQQFTGQCQACKSGKVGRLVDAKLLDAKMLKLCENAGECDKEALAAYLSLCEGMKQSTCAALCNLPGRGGVNRGRGDAALTWKDPTRTETMEFKEEILPPGTLAAMRDSRMVGVSTGDPASQEPIGPSGSGALTGARATGGTARGHPLLPVHRRTVDQYFKRD